MRKTAEKNRFSNVDAGVTLHLFRDLEFVTANNCKLVTKK